MQKVHFQLFCFSTDFNFDYRFLEGITGGIFVMWFWWIFEIFFFFAYWLSDLVSEHTTYLICK